MGVLQTYMTYSFIRILTQRWEETDAYKFGIIDADGNPLKKFRELDNQEQKDVYTIWHRMIFKIKRLLEKVPFGKTLMASYISALWLIKENMGSKGDFDKILEAFCKHVGYDPKENKSLTEELADNNILEPGRYIVVTEYTDFIHKEILHIKESLKPIDSILGFPVYTYQGNPFTQFDVFKLEEDVNTVGGGSIAGANEDPPGPAKLTSLLRRKKFAGMEVFECNDEVYHRCINGKPKYHRYSTYVGDDEIGQAIRSYGLEAQKKPIILQNSKTGHMIYLRKQGY